MISHYGQCLIRLYHPSYKSNNAGAIRTSIYEITQEKRLATRMEIDAILLFVAQSFQQGDERFQVTMDVTNEVKHCVDGVPNAPAIQAKKKPDGQCLCENLTGWLRPFMS